MLDKGWERRITNIYKSCYLHIKYFPANSLAALMWRWCLNSKISSLTAGGRRFKECEMGQEKTPITWLTCVQGEGYENDGI